MKQKKKIKTLNKRWKKIKGKKIESVCRKQRSLRTERENAQLSRVLNSRLSYWFESHTTWKNHNKTKKQKQLQTIKAWKSSISSYTIHSLFKRFFHNSRTHFFSHFAVFFFFLVESDLNLLQCRRLNFFASSWVLFLTYRNRGKFTLDLP